MADCDCYGSLFSHDPGCATELERLVAWGYRDAAALIGGQRPEPVLSAANVADLRARIGAARADLDDMAESAPAHRYAEAARFRGKSQGLGLALSYLEEYLR